MARSVGVVATLRALFVLLLVSPALAASGGSPGQSPPPPPPKPAASTPPPKNHSSPPKPHSPPLKPHTPPVPGPIFGGPIVPHTPPAPPHKPGSPPNKPGSPPKKPGSPPSKPGSPPNKPGSPPNKPGSPPNKPGSPPNQPGSPPLKPNSPPLKPGSPPPKPGSPPPKNHTRPPRPRPPPCSPPPVYCHKPGGVCDDPVLVGADGMQFYFHGHKDADFCLVSDAHLHVNAHFIGRRGANMSRDFTWVQSLGILFDTNQLYVGANKVATWNDSVDQLTIAFGSEPVALPAGDGASWAVPGLAITRVGATNAVSVHVPGKLTLLARVVPITQAENLKHNYGVTPDDCFAHLELSFRFHSLTAGVSGVLGQTYAPGFRSLPKLPGQLMPTMPRQAQYESSSLMAPDCAVSAFGSSNAAQILTNLKPMSCDQGGSTGMVCRR